MKTGNFLLVLMGLTLTLGCRMPFHPSQPMSSGFAFGFSSTLRKELNCSDSDWDCLIRPKMAWPDVALEDIKT